MKRAVIAGPVPTPCAAPSIRGGAGIHRVINHKLHRLFCLLHLQEISSKNSRIGCEDERAAAGFVSARAAGPIGPVSGGPRRSGLGKVSSFIVVPLSDRRLSCTQLR
jgi:hypothetical protein